jgi:hypothetical protein
MNQSVYSVMAGELQKLSQGGFATSQFSGPIGPALPLYLESSIPPFRKPPILVKKAFQTSQFSGPLSMGSFPQVSSLPPFTMPSPSVKGGLPNLGRLAHPGGGVQVKAAGAGMGTVIASGSTPAQSLAITKRVGSSQVGAQPGPSIAQQVKPMNFGKGSPVGPTMPGAGRGGI